MMKIGQDIGGIQQSDEMLREIAQRNHPELDFTGQTLVQLPFSVEAAGKLLLRISSLHAGGQQRGRDRLTQ